MACIYSGRLRCYKFLKSMCVAQTLVFRVMYDHMRPCICVRRIILQGRHKACVIACSNRLLPCTEFRLRFWVLSFPDIPLHFSVFLSFARSPGPVGCMALLVIPSTCKALAPLFRHNIVFRLIVTQKYTIRTIARIKVECRILPLCWSPLPKLRPEHANLNLKHSLSLYAIKC